jgi:hypothetical protein
MMALHTSIGIMNQGRAVIYMDEEGGQELVQERLYALGAHPDMVSELFIYIPFPKLSWDDEDLLALDEVFEVVGKCVAPVGLIVFDSLPDFLAAAGLNEDKAQDVTNFVHKVLGVARERGVAQLVLDHLVKPEKGAKTRSKYSRGSGAKLGKADAAILIETAHEFDAKTSGQLGLYKTKDRYGRLDVPKLGEVSLLVDVIVQSGHIEFREAGAAYVVPYDREAQIDRQVVAVLQANGECSTNKILHAKDEEGKKVITFSDGDVRSRLDQLVRSGRVVCSNGLRDSKNYRLAGNGDGIPRELTI